MYTSALREQQRRIWGSDHVVPGSAWSRDLVLGPRSCCQCTLKRHLSMVIRSVHSSLARRIIYQTEKPLPLSKNDANRGRHLSPIEQTRCLNPCNYKIECTHPYLPMKMTSMASRSFHSWITDKDHGGDPIDSVMVSVQFSRYCYCCCYLVPSYTYAYRHRPGNQSVIRILDWIERSTWLRCERSSSSSAMALVVGYLIPFVFPSDQRFRL